MSDDYEYGDAGAAYDPNVLEVAAQVARQVATEQNTTAAQIAHQQWLYEQQVKDQREAMEKAEKVLVAAKKVVPGLEDEHWAPKIHKLATGFMPDSIHDEEGIVAAYKRAATILQDEANAAERESQEQAERAAWQRIHDRGSGLYGSKSGQ